uniref:Uncharacterized protein n=1 Tax=Prolemur simus TaxID=1328070 RepID=A0A8C8ZE43_PROSS
SLPDVGALRARARRPPADLWAQLPGSFSSPGCTTDLHMWDNGIQQRMSPPSSFYL